MQAKPGCGELLRDGKAALNAGKYAEAESHYSRAVVECDNPAQVDARLVTAFADLGFARMALGQHDNAALALRRAVTLLEALPGASPFESAKLWQALGTTYYQQHLYSQAESAYRRALDLSAAAGTLDPQAACELSSNLAAVYIVQHRNDKADAALEVARRALAQSSATESNWRIHLLVAVAVMHHVRGRSAEAEAVLREAVAGLDRIPNPDGTLVVAALNNLAVEYMSRGDYAAARGVLSRAVGRAEQGLPFSQPETRKIFANYRICLQHTRGRKEIREFDSRARLILSAIPRAPADGMLIDFAQLGPKNSGEQLNSFCSQEDSRCD